MKTFTIYLSDVHGQMWGSEAIEAETADEAVVVALADYTSETGASLVDVADVVTLAGTCSDLAAWPRHDPERKEKLREAAVRLAYGLGIVDEDS